MGAMIEDLLFCEPAMAAGPGRWCLRFVGEKGEMYGGGIDTPSLCGRVDPKLNGWDIDVPVTQDRLDNPDITCLRCLRELKEIIGE